MSRIGSFQTMMAEMGDKAGSLPAPNPDVADIHVKKTRQKVKIISARVVSGARGATYFVRNVLDNGTLKGNLNDWTTLTESGITATVALSVDNGRVETDAQSDPDAVEAHITGSTGGGMSGVYQDFATVAGQVWSASAYKYLISQTATGAARLRIQFFDSGLSSLAVHESDDAVVDTAFEIITNLNRTAPSSTAWVRIFVAGVAIVASDLAKVRFDDIMAHIGTSAPTRNDNIVAGFCKAT